MEDSKPCPHCGQPLKFLGNQEDGHGGHIDQYHCTNPACLEEVTRSYRGLCAITPAEFVRLRQTVEQMQRLKARSSLRARR